MSDVWEDDPDHPEKDVQPIAETSRYSKGFRLANVVAAIQVLGVNSDARMKVDDWQKLLGNVRGEQKSWNDIFLEHPEFFKLTRKNVRTIDKKKRDTVDWAVLQMRLARPRNFDILRHLELSTNEAKQAIGIRPRDISQSPITSGEMETLLKLATELHNREIAQEQQKHWKMPLQVAAISAGTSILLCVVTFFSTTYAAHLVSPASKDTNGSAGIRDKSIIELTTEIKRINTTVKELKGRVQLPHK